MDQYNRAPNGDETVRVSPNNLPPANPVVPPNGRICPNCHAQIPEGYSFCGSCGQPLYQPQSQAFIPPQPVVIYPQGYNPQQPVKKPTNPVVYILAGLGGLILLVVIALIIANAGGQLTAPAIPSATPDLSTQVVILFQTAVAQTTTAGEATAQAKPLPTATPEIVQPPVDPSPEELTAWFMNALAGAPENYEMILSTDGIIGAPGFTGCESGDCFPEFSVHESITLIEDAKAMSSMPPACLSYVSYENQVLVNVTDLAFDRDEFLPGYGDDFGAYQFAFFREDASEPYRLTVIIGIQESMMDSIQPGVNDYLACP